MKLWLKIICISLLLYAGVSSLYHPMTPGGLSVSASELHPGRNDFTFTGYGSHFNDAMSSLQVFVTSDTSGVYCAEVLQVVDNAHVIVSVFLPDTLSSNNLGFFANNDLDGTMFVESPLGSEGFTFVKGTANDLCEYKITNSEQQFFGFPFQPIIMESIRNLMWHVPMWFTMFALMIFSFAFSIRALGKNGGAVIAEYDLKASASAGTGLLFCVLGLITGSVWARFTWGAWWTNDPQLNGAMVVFMVYVAYFILRKSTPDEDKRARLSAIFNIFAFVLMVVLLMVMPRFTEGLHPGKSGNPAFSKYDLDSSLRSVFYPACFGFILLGYWLFTLNLRMKKIEIEHETTH
jgi:heme exporter protein C